MSLSKVIKLPSLLQKLEESGYETLDEVKRECLSSLTKGILPLSFVRVGVLIAILTTTRRTRAKQGRDKSSWKARCKR